jgi:deazaflavin-dependent oxidoreductase (nitroreductase family)
MLFRGFRSLEQKFFRALNSVVEPAVRRGAGWPAFGPSGLIVLESLGFKSGKLRRSPLLATRLQDHLIVSTYRGERSFWIKNLQKKAEVRYYLGGEAREAEAFVVTPGQTYQSPLYLPPLVGMLTDALAPLTRRGWSFAVLIPLPRTVKENA